MIIREREYYRNLVTSEYRGGKKFNAMIRKMVDYNCLLDRSILSIVDRFDVETAEDDQLDILGECVGVSRNLTFEPSKKIGLKLICPKPAELKRDTGAESIYNVYETPVPPDMEESMVISGCKPENMENFGVITDEIYRIMVKARIIQNIWKGNVLDLYEMWHNLFDETKGIQIQDLQDMSFNIVMIGNFPDIIRELIIHGYIIPKPAGVRINILSFISTDGLPIFSYNYNTLNYSGYTSHWIQTTEIVGG